MGSSSAFLGFMKLKKTTKLLLPLFLGLLAILSVSCTLLIFREQKTMALLINGPNALQPTEVYARWLALTPDARITAQALRSELKALEYQQVPRLPARAGEYQDNGQSIAFYSRGFRYPDKDYPALAIQVHFDKRGIENVEYATGGNIPEWRLEPKRLARWASADALSRMPVNIAELPPYVPEAVIAIEDKRFYSHGAIDFIGVMRALVVDVKKGSLHQGASTISQQLARSIFLDVNRTWRRKFLEAGLAFYLEARFSKPKLLEMYLNQVYWGQDGPENLLGIESASRAYFAKPARQLTLAEAALLAGMLQSPNRLSPRTDLPAALARQRVVLGEMREQKRITQAQFASAVAQKIVVPPSGRRSNDAAYFLASLRDELSERYSIPLLLSQGWRIYTTLDPVLQSSAAEGIASLVAGRKKQKEQAFEEGALVALDPANGAVRAWVGGTGYQTSPFNRASNAFRQPGSVFKPFVVLAALEGKKATTATLLEDKPLETQDEEKPWSPQNYDKTYRGKASVWDSLVLSLNVPMVRLAIMAGLNEVVAVAQRAGIGSPLRAVPSIALGTSEVTVSELTAAYAPFANGGERVMLHMVEAIVDPEGSVVELFEDQNRRIFDKPVIYLVTQMLQAVFNEGTARAARSFGLQAPVAGKTGTSENYQDAWFVGYSPDLVTGVWVGYDKPKSLGRSAAGIALPIWTRFMMTALSHYPDFTFERPSGLEARAIDMDSGQLVRTGCTHRRTALFLPGTAPSQDCPLHPGGIVGFWKRLTGKK